MASGVRFGSVSGPATADPFADSARASSSCSSSTSCEAVSPAATKTGVVDVVGSVPGVKGKKNAPGDHFTYS